ILGPAAETKSLLDLATMEGFQSNNRGLRTLIIGVDISEWFKQAQFPYTLGPPTLEHTLSELVSRVVDHLRLPIKMLFVFNGVQCASDRERQKTEGTALLAREFQKFLGVLGIPFYTAPAEAESELAQMSAHHLIDAVCTDRSDTFALGAFNILRKCVLSSVRRVPLISPSWNFKGASFGFYTAQTIRDCPQVALSHGGFVLVALLAGCPRSVGIVGCGSTLALSLARQGLGDELVDAVQNLTGHNLSLFISAWKVKLIEELRVDPGGHRPRRYPTLANRVAENRAFPDLSILRYYVSPPTSWSNAGPGPPPLLFRPIDLGGFSALCETLLPSLYPRSIKVFSKHLYPAACMQVLSKVFGFLLLFFNVLIGAGCSEPPSAARRRGIRRLRRASLSCRYHASHRLPTTPAFGLSDRAQH
ncbi:PIN domain-like protein, partial [Mycena metata]